MRALCSERPTGLRPRTPAADAPEDGSGFDLAVMAGAVRRGGLMPGRSKVLGWRHLSAAHGDSGQISYDALQ